jgi:hypothetical protein
MRRIKERKNNNNNNNKTSSKKEKLWKLISCAFFKSSSFSKIVQ